MGIKTPIRIYIYKMKLAVAATLAVASAQDKKVPPRHPLSRLNKLEKFANEWLVANTDAKVASHWEKKYEKNNPIRGLQQIMRGFQRWAERYIADCKLQPEKQATPSKVWRDILMGKMNTE